LTLIYSVASLKCFSKLQFCKLARGNYIKHSIICLKVRVAGEKSRATKSHLPMHYVSRRSNKVMISWHAIKLVRHLFSIIPIM